MPNLWSFIYATLIPTENISLSLSLSPSLSHSPSASTQSQIPQQDYRKQQRYIQSDHRQGQTGDGLASITIYYRHHPDTLLLLLLLCLIFNHYYSNLLTCQCKYSGISKYRTVCSGQQFCPMYIEIEVIPISMYNNISTNCQDVSALLSMSGPYRDVGLIKQL